MAVMDTVKHVRLRFKTLLGYVKLMLTSDSVVMKDGKNLQTKVDELSNSLYEMSYHAGDVLSVNLSTAGYLTTSRTDVSFTIPVCKPIGKDVTSVTVSAARATLRQNNNYVWGSGTSTSDIASNNGSVYASVSVHGLRCTLHVPTMVLATNNDAIGIVFTATFTFN